MFFFPHFKSRVKSYFKVNNKPFCDPRRMVPKPDRNGYIGMVVFGGSPSSHYAVTTIIRKTREIITAHKIYVTKQYKFQKTLSREVYFLHNIIT